MSVGDASNEKRYDPMETFRGMRDAYLGAMAKTMTEAVNSESYAQASGTMLESYLNASAPVKEALDRSMLQTLEQLSLPSRLDIISLAERFTNLELRLDDMDSKLDELMKLTKTSAAEARARDEALQAAVTEMAAAAKTAAKTAAAKTAGNSTVTNSAATSKPAAKAPAARKKTSARKVTK